MSRKTSPFLTSTDIGIDIVGEQIEGASADQIEAGVVPIACKDAVFNRPAMQGEAHVRTAVINGMELIAVMKDNDGYWPLGYQQGTLSLNLLQGTNVDDPILPVHDADLLASDHAPNLDRNKDELG